MIIKFIPNSPIQGPENTYFENALTLRQKILHPTIRFQISFPALCRSLLAAPSPKTDLFSMARLLRYGRT